MAVKKSALYSSLWASCDQLRGGMDASQYKDYVLTMLFVKYVSDKYAHQPDPLIDIPEGATFEAMVKLKGTTNIGDDINRFVLAKLSEAMEGAVSFPDFNDDDKLGSGKDKVDRLSNLIAIFENPALNFKNNRADDDDILGDAYEYLMRHFATESGKSKGQFYTPAEVSRILAKIIDVHKADRANYTVYDPTCGSGSLLLKVDQNANVAGGLTLYGQEKDIATKGLALMNMWLHNRPEATIMGGNTIAQPAFVHEGDSGNLWQFDYVVANPPFSIKNWSNGISPDQDVRFRGYGVPPEKNGDYAFLLHIVASIKARSGKGAVILPHGVLFRGNAEADIRQALVRQGIIKGIIGLPANLFYGTGIPACIIVIDKENADLRQGIFMIDASQGYRKDGNKNRLREQDIHLITDTFNQQTTVEGYARFVPHDEIAQNDYNLNLPRYIDNQAAEDVQDLSAHLAGGIPEADIEALDHFWQVYPALKADLFAPLRPGYSQLKVATDALKAHIFAHPEFVAHQQALRQVFDDWATAHHPTLEGINPDTAPKRLIGTIAEVLLASYQGKALVNNYDVYQHLMDYWEAVMKDDVYMIAEDGWQAKVERVVEINKKGKAVDKGWRCDLVPKPLVVARYLASEQAAIDATQLEKENLENDYQSLLEEHSHEEGVFGDVEGKVNKATLAQKLLEYEDLACRSNFAEAYAQQESTRDARQALEQKLDALTSEKILDNYLGELVDGKGKLTKGKVQKRVMKLKADLEADIALDPALKMQAQMIQKDLHKCEKWRTGQAHPSFKELDVYFAYLQGLDEVADLQKEEKTQGFELRNMLAKAMDNDALDYIAELQALHTLIKQSERIAYLNGELKKLHQALDDALLAQYEQLSPAEVQTLVIDDKWKANLGAAIQGEIEGISQRLTARLQALSTRYAHTLGELDAKAAALENKVQAHLKAMGLSWEN